MASTEAPVRVLYSYPARIGAGRTCYTAWQQVRGLAAAGAQVTAMPGSIVRPLPPAVATAPTLARGPVRVPYRALGQARALELHDRIVARRLPALADRIDLVHTWPQGALATLRTARRLGIPTVLERPNTHTRHAYAVVRRECERLGLELPPGAEHAHDEAVLDREEAEFDAAGHLLCPSAFVLASFRGLGFPAGRLMRHGYGYDETVFHPPSEPRPADTGLTVLFAGFAAVRKGLHLALEAWRHSPASTSGRLLIAGDILPAYARFLERELAHPTVEVLGHRTDLPELMRRSDVLVLPSLEEGSSLVCLEAIGSDCVPLVSDAASAVCRHEDNALVHRAGDVRALAGHLTLVDRDREWLARLRDGCRRTAPECTWTAAGRRLLDVYRAILAEQAATRRPAG